MKKIKLSNYTLRLLRKEKHAARQWNTYNSIIQSLLEIKKGIRSKMTLPYIAGLYDGEGSTTVSFKWKGKRIASIEVRVKISQDSKHNQTLLNQMKTRLSRYNIHLIPLKTGLMICSNKGSERFFKLIAGNLIIKRKEAYKVLKLLRILNNLQMRCKCGRVWNIKNKNRFVKVLTSIRRTHKKGPAPKYTPQNGMFIVKRGFLYFIPDNKNNR